MKKYMLTFTAFFIAASAQANMEFVAMGGAGIIDVDDFTLQVTEWETDKLFQTNPSEWSPWTAQIGMGYIYAFEKPLLTGDVRWFSSITPQINLYYMNGYDITGEVYQFESPEYHFLNEEMHYNSTRLMFDLNINIAQYQWLSLYAIAGAGAAWHVFDIHAKPNEAGLDCGVIAYDFQTGRLNTFAYEFGAGVTVPIVNHFSVSLEYLYAGFHDISLENDVSAGFDIEGSELSLTSQSILLGFRFAL